MTLAEVAALLYAALVRVFTGTPFKVWQAQPDQTAVPAVWIDDDTGFVGADLYSTGQVVFTVAAALAPQVSAKTTETRYQATDLLHTITPRELGHAVTGREWRTDVAQIGGVDHVALMYSFTLAYAPPC